MRVTGRPRSLHEELKRMVLKHKLRNRCEIEYLNNRKIFPRFKLLSLYCKVTILKSVTTSLSSLNLSPFDRDPRIPVGDIADKRFDWTFSVPQGSPVLSNLGYQGVRRSSRITINQS